LFEDVGKVFAAVSLEGEGVLEGAGDLVGAVDFTQGDDLLDVVGGVEAFVLEFAGVEFGLGAELEEGQQEGRVTGPLALGQQVLEVIGIADVLVAIIAAEVGGDEFLVVIDEQLIGVNLQAQFLGGVEGRHGVTVGVQHDATAAIGAGRTDDGAVVGQRWQGFEVGLFLGEVFLGFTASFAVEANVGDGVEPLPEGGMEGGEAGDVQAVEEVLFHVADARFDAALLVGAFDRARDGLEAVVVSKVQVAGMELGALS
jgi:hypothetical protein